jgi:hypothetical protein
VPADRSRIAMVGGVIFALKAPQHFIDMADRKGSSFVAVVIDVDVQIAENGDVAGTSW